MRIPKSARKLIISILLMVVSLTFAYDDKTEIDEIISVFLESYNQLDGIELVGGPFERSQYSGQIIYNIDNVANPIINYKYKENDTVVVWPSDFTVGIHSKVYYPLLKSSDPVLVSEAAKKVLIQQGIRIDSLPSLDESPLFYSPVSIVQISSDGNILRKEGILPFVHKVTEYSPNSLFVFYNETYNSSFFYDILNMRNFTLLQIEKNSNWNALGPTKATNHVPMPKTDHHFVLFGKIEDRPLLSLIKKARQLYPELQILAIVISPDNEALLYQGDLKAVTKWLKNRPTAVAVFEKKEDWRISKTVAIYNIDRFCLDIPVQIFPLTPKLNNHQLSEIRKNVTLETKLDEAEVMELIHYAYRFRGVSNNILIIKDIGPNEVEIKLGDYEGSVFKFKKINNKWLISGYYEYVS